MLPQAKTWHSDAGCRNCVSPILVADYSGRLGYAENDVAVYVAMHAVSRDPTIEVINEQSATRHQRAMIARETILLTEDT